MTLQTAALLDYRTHTDSMLPQYNKCTSSGWRRWISE